MSEIGPSIGMSPPGSEAGWFCPRALLLGM